jgi:hypothetical protein
MTLHDFRPVASYGIIGSGRCLQHLFQLRHLTVFTLFPTSGTLAAQ